MESSPLVGVRTGIEDCKLFLRQKPLQVNKEGSSPNQLEKRIQGVKGSRGQGFVF